MYSIVLLTAMSAGGDAPAFHPGAGCLGGCYGGCYGGWSGCSGSGYGGCFGGCHGGGRGFLGHKARGGFLGHRRASCHGCSGYSCSGYNCFASCYGGGFGGCHGGYAGCYGGPGVGYAVPTDVWGAAHPAVWTTGYGPNQPPVMTVPVAPSKTDDSDAKPNSANITFKVPADARIFVDGKPTPGTGTERSFYTPPLAPGKYFYEVKAELVVDGRMVTEEKRVIVEAGANLTETFPKLTAAASATETIAGK
jgi:uncharacterized protein (TIGR03000 family)